MIQDRRRLGEHLAIVEYERGNPAQRIELADALEVFADRPIAMLERDPSQCMLTATRRT
jgi:hypothetical protein